VSFMVDVLLPADPRACSEARARLERLRSRVGDQIVEDAELLASELVANSVRHSGLRASGEVHLQAELDPDRIVVRVSDPGPGFRPGPGKPVSRPFGGGWGLVLLDRIAERWGVEPSSSANTVWFELATSGSEAA
jgi:anti-sigma regulatory factor (Ser/Thr protein kinase)